MSDLLFPSKILLAGEYTVIHGGSALAIPYTCYNGKWRCKITDHEPESNQEIDHFLEHLTEKESQLLDLNLLKQDYLDGHRFFSSIPHGYGLGSSGALVASLYQHYAKNKKNGLNELKKDLALLENFFHGQSSGLDPLVSYLNSPLLIQGLANFKTLTMDSLSLDKLKSFYLYDSKMPRISSPLIKVFTEKCEDINFLNDALSKLLVEVDRLVNVLIDKNQNNTLEIMRNISTLQFEHFQEMIPAQVKMVWAQGLLSQNFFMKLCGAGGGGYFLTYLPENNPEIIQKLSLKQLV